MLIERLVDTECPLKARLSLKQVRVAWNSKRAWGLGGRGRSPTPFADRMLIERLLDGMSIDGTPLSEAGGWGGGGGDAQPPHLRAECS